MIVKNYWKDSISKSLTKTSTLCMSLSRDSNYQYYFRSVPISYKNAVPLNTLPDRLYIRGPRYKIRFNRIDDISI